MSTSCESHRTNAYSEDLRWRIVWESEGLGLTMKEVAQNLGINKSTVCRVLNRFLITGSVTAKIYPREKTFRMLTTPAQILILNLIVQKPGIYLREIQKELQESLLLQV